MKMWKQGLLLSFFLTIALVGEAAPGRDDDGGEMLPWDSALLGEIFPHLDERDEGEEADDDLFVGLPEHFLAPHQSGSAAAPAEIVQPSSPSLTTSSNNNSGHHPQQPAPFDYGTVDPSLLASLAGVDTSGVRQQVAEGKRKVRWW